jgi:uncharacterized protein (TIGR02145 family)
MKSIIRISGIFLLVLLICSCKKEVIPTISTSAIENITGTSALCGGNITNEGSGTVIARGICWSTNIVPTILDNKTTDGAGAGSFTSNITGLNGATVYYVRAYATNAVGTGYGMAMSFSTLGQAPTASTQAAISITGTSAQLYGKVNANYLSTTVTFEYGTTTNYGQTISAEHNPTTGNSFVSVKADIFGLIPGTIYHFRVKAINSLGTTYGNDMSFTTKVTDGSGNNYSFVTIGNQVWLASNLKTTKYSNGDVISSGIYVQGNDLNNAAIYGRLYIWTVAVDGRNICPVGWHVPSEVEWNVLLSNVTSPADLKEQGYVHWFSPNTGATNSVLFTALPGGYYDGSVTTAIQAIASFWFKDEANATMGKGFKLYYNNSPNTGDFVFSEKNTAFSVRCLKND